MNGGEIKEDKIIRGRRRGVPSKHHCKSNPRERVVSRKGEREKKKKKGGGWKWVRGTLINWGIPKKK